MFYIMFFSEMLEWKQRNKALWIWLKDNLILQKNDSNQEYVFLNLFDGILK